MDGDRPARPLSQRWSESPTIDHVDRLEARLAEALIGLHWSVALLANRFRGDLRVEDAIKRFRDDAFGEDLLEAV